MKRRKKKTSCWSFDLFELVILYKNL